MSLSSIRARVEAATKGPWKGKSFDECQTAILGGAGLIATVSVGEGRPQGESNADFIVYAHNDDIPYLLARIERLEKVMDVAKSMRCDAPFDDSDDWSHICRRCYLRPLCAAIAKVDGP